MRIIAGQFKGRKLFLPQGQDIRPTADKIRGAIFNALAAQNALADSLVLDCFCGTGALGLEALSRGARHALFIDQNPVALDLARKNTALCQAQTQAQFILASLPVLAPMHDPAFKATLVFLDPPYRKGLIHPTIQALIAGSWLAPLCRIILESEKSCAAFMTHDITVENEKIYGETKICFARYTPSAVSCA